MLALVTDAFGGRGGIAQYNRDILNALVTPSGGLVSSILVLPRHAPDPVVSSSSKIEQPPARPGRISYTIAALRSAIFSPVDIVFCGHINIAPLAAIISWLKGGILIIQAHGIEVWGQPSSLQRAAVEAADLVLCVSRHTRATLLSWAVIAPERAIVLPDTVGDAFTPGEGSALRSALGLDGKRVLLTVGRVDSRERYKGHDRVIAAIPELIEQRHDVAYVVIGEGDDCERLKDLAIEVGVHERVHFLGAVGPEGLVEAYRMADLFVMPSTGEGFGIAFLEAMASGTPAIGLGVAGSRDALADGELGIVAMEETLVRDISVILSSEKRDPEALARAVSARFGHQAFERRLRATFRMLPLACSH